MSLFLIFSLGRNVNSGLGDEGTIDLSVLDESDDDSDGESASTDTGSTHSDASETMTSRMSSNVSLSARVSQLGSEESTRLVCFSHVVPLLLFRNVVGGMNGIKKTMKLILLGIQCQILKMIRQLKV